MDSRLTIMEGTFDARFFDSQVRVFNGAVAEVYGGEIFDISVYSGGELRIAGGDIDLLQARPDATVHFIASSAQLGLTDLATTATLYEP